MPKNTAPLPDWELILSSAARLRRIVPDGAGHVPANLRHRFDDVLAQLESVAGCKTARVQCLVQIVGRLNGIETGVHQLVRDEPLETQVVDHGGEHITIPTESEILRIKGALILKRNATRDYLDFMALATHLGDKGVADALQSFDRLYPQANNESPLQQLQVQLANARPYDLEEIELAEYKNLNPRWHDWQAIKTDCAHLATVVFDKVCEMQTEKSLAAAPYKLNTKQHEAIYTSNIAPKYLLQAKPQEHPCAFITGGQPGSGKSRLTNMGKERFRETGYVLVDADKTRVYHPSYDKLMETDDRTAANLTHPDAGPWASRLIHDGIASHRNLIIDQTSRDPAAMTKLTQKLRQAGYRIELHVMAVSPAISTQRIFQRYEDQREGSGYGRFSTKDKHDEAYAGVADTIASVQANRQVDQLRLYDRSGTMIYNNSLEHGEWQTDRIAQERLNIERTRPMNLQECENYLKGFDRLAEQLARPERQASADEIRQIKNLQRQAKEEPNTTQASRTIKKLMPKNMGR